MVPIVRIEVTSDGDVYVNGKEVAGFLRLFGRRKLLYEDLVGMAHDEGDLVFNSLRRFIITLERISRRVSVSIVFARHVLSTAGVRIEGLDTLKYLAVPPHVPDAPERTIVPRVLVDAYEKLRPILAQPVSIDATIGVDENKLEGRSVSFPYLSWLGFADCSDGEVDYVRFNWMIEVECHGIGFDATIYLDKPTTMDLINLLYLFKSLGVSGYYASLSRFLPDPPEHLFISRREIREDALKYVMFRPTDPLSSYFAHILRNVEGDEFVAPVVRNNRVEWVRVRVKRAYVLDSAVFHEVESKGVMLFYRDGGFRGRVVLLPRYRSNGYHRAIREFLRRNENTEFMRDMMNNATELAERLNNLAEFLTTEFIIL